MGSPAGIHQIADLLKGEEADAQRQGKLRQHQPSLRKASQHLPGKAQSAIDAMRPVPFRQKQETLFAFFFFKNTVTLLAAAFVLRAAVCISREMSEIFPYFSSLCTFSCQAQFFTFIFLYI